MEELRELSAKYGEEVVSHLAQSYTEEGSTPLLLAIQYERLNLVEFLIGKLKAPLNQTGCFVWEEEEYEDVPPLFAAIISGQFSITKYLTSHEFHFGSYDHNDPYLPLFSTSKSRSDKIDVLELMGAADILFNWGNWGIGWQFWEEELKLREQHPKIPQNPHQPSDLLPPQTIECQNLKELLSVTLYSPVSHRNRQDQALLVSERILKQLGKDRSKFFSSFVYGAVCLMRTNYGYTFEFLLRMIGCIETYQWNPKRIEDSEIVCSVALSLISLCVMYSRLHPIRNSFSFSCSMKVLGFVSWFIDIVHQHAWLQDRSNKIERAEKEALEFAVTVLQSLSRFSSSEKREFQTCLSHFIRKVGGSSQWPANIINWVCQVISCNTNFLSSSFQKSDCIRFLLDAGVDENACDKFGNTPLVILGKGELESIDIECIKMLLDAGGHMDLANEEGFSALNILKRRQSENSEIFPLINRVQPLMCCCKCHPQ